MVTSTQPKHMILCSIIRFIASTHCNTSFNTPSFIIIWEIVLLFLLWKQISRFLDATYMHSHSFREATSILHGWARSYVEIGDILHHFVFYLLFF